MSSITDRIVTITWLGLGAFTALVSGLLFWGSAVAHSQAREQLQEQHLIIPTNTTGLKDLPSTDREALSPHAGRAVQDPARAQMYQDHFVRVRLSQLGQGRSFRQVSTDYAQRCSSNPKSSQCRDLRGIKEDMRQVQILQGFLTMVHTLTVGGSTAKAAAWISSFTSLGFLVAGLMKLGHVDQTAPEKARRARHVAT